MSKLRIKPDMKSKIESIGRELSNYFTRNRKFKYSIQSSDGTIWSDLYLNKLSSLYNVDSGEYNLIYQQGDEFFDIIGNRKLNNEEVNNIWFSSPLNIIKIDSYITEEDIQFKRIMPLVDGKTIKERIEEKLKKDYKEIKRKVK